MSGDPMTDPTDRRPSYEPGRRWSAGFHVVVGVVALFAIVVMVNYLAATRMRWRYDWSSAQRPQLSPLTVATLGGLTNEVKAVVLFDPASDLYRHVKGLLREYALQSPRISVQLVDYVRDATLATAIKSRYGLGANTGDLVVFDAGGGRFRTVDDSEMSTYDADVKGMMAGKNQEIRRVAFRGEALFTAALASLSESSGHRAYFLRGHGENDPASDDERIGYSRFARLLAEKNVESMVLTNLLSGVPEDCSLLVVAGPVQPLLTSEAAAVSKYLDRGGRVLVTLSLETLRRQGHLEGLLEEWGVFLPSQLANDQKKSVRGFDIIAEAFGSHPVTSPLTRAGAKVHFQAPRVVVPIPANRLPADAPKTTALVMTGAKGRTLSDFDGREFSFVEGKDREGEIPMAVASEKGGVSGLSAGRGTARLIVIGDAAMWANLPLENSANRDFAALCVNWLLDRQQSMAIGPRALSEYRLNLTGPQLRLLTGVLLGALPGGVLILGFMVWARRRG
jgi:hypothetical protein